MAVIENRATAVGDVIVIRTNLPATGLISLAGFSDVVTGETPTRNFDKTFRYTLDGVNYTDWKTLDNTNLSVIEIFPTDTFLAEYRYTRVGNDNTGELAVLEIQLNGEFVEIVCPLSFQNSIFFQFFGCQNPEMLRWAVNVLEKIYKPGIIPTYIIRGLEDGSSATRRDQDYIDFWRTVATFFAYIVHYARTLQNFVNNVELLTDYIEQYDLTVCPDTEIQELFFILQNQHKQFAARGTRRVFETVQQNGQIAKGEFLRAACYDDQCDEFIFSLQEPQNIGWNVGNASPLIRTVVSNFGISKKYEEQISDISKYPVVASGGVSVNVEQFQGKNVIRINGDATAGQFYGIGFTSGINISQFGFNMSPNIGYRISFEVLKLSVDDVVFVGANGFNESSQIVSPVSIIDNSETNVFTNQGVIAQNVWFPINAFLFSYNEPNRLLNEGGVLEIGFGANLKSTESFCKFIPSIGVLPSVGGAVDYYLKNIEIVPLQTDYSTGFLNVPSFAKAFVKNNNQNLSNENLTRLTREKLTPYNLLFDIQYI